MADVTITIDGNTTQLVTSAKKAQDALRAMGSGLDQTGQKMERVGKITQNAFEKSAMSLAKTLIGAQALSAALTSAGEKVQSLRNKVTELGAQRGQLALRTDRAAIAGGLDQGAASAFVQGVSPVSQDERVNFVEALAKADLGLSPERTNELYQGVSSGAYSAEQALQAGKMGDAIDVAGRLSQLSPDAQNELRIATIEDSFAAKTRGADSTGARVFDAAQNANDLASPGRAAFRSFMQDFDATGLSGATETLLKSAIQLKQSTKKLNTSGATDNQ